MQSFVSSFMKFIHKPYDKVCVLGGDNRSHICNNLHGVSLCNCCCFACYFVAFTASTNNSKNTHISFGSHFPHLQIFSSVTSPSMCAFGTFKLKPIIIKISKHKIHQHVQGQFNAFLLFELEH